VNEIPPNHETPSQGGDASSTGPASPVDAPEPGTLRPTEASLASDACVTGDRANFSTFPENFDARHDWWKRLGDGGYMKPRLQS